MIFADQAIGKYVNPTRYRQIIETESSDLLSVEEQGVISLDQKHTSNVAKVHYQKKRSRSVAQKAMNCTEKLINNSETTIEEQSGGHSLGSGPDEEMESCYLFNHNISKWKISENVYLT